MTLVQAPQTYRSNEPIETLRRGCRGMQPLDARLEPWMVDLLANQPALLREAVARYGSPLNLISTTPFVRNIRELQAVAENRQLPFRVFFAHKANKCPEFIDAALSVHAGVDVASEQECRQALRRGASGEDLTCTAAVKSSSLLELCVENRITIVLDNLDELNTLRHVATRSRCDALAALRVSGFRHREQKLYSRFGIDVEELPDFAAQMLHRDTADRIHLHGLHFHLDGYCAAQRVSAIRELLPLVDQLRGEGHLIQFVDIGGGIPMSYLNEGEQWIAFWAAHQDAMLHRGEPVTYRNHGLGLTRFDDQLLGERNVYPFYQSPTRADWLDKILQTASRGGGTLAEQIRERELELRCEPGRSILDGCGITAARVEFCKRHASGDYLIGLAMNHTQCRTSSDDFLVDPLLIRRAVEGKSDVGQENMEGYLVGSYCMESDLISLRKLSFPRGVAPGDLIVIPNTAGYLMHFMESRSHQFPLAANLLCIDEKGTVMRIGASAAEELIP